jgi:hypothetical protein
MTMGYADDDDEREHGVHPMPGRWAVRTVLTLASLTLLLFVIATTTSGVLEPPIPPQPPSPPLLPAPTCERLSDLELEQAAERWWATVEAGLRGEPLAETEQAIETRVEEAFAPVYTHIPEFLDWHYSLAGQYTQLANVIVTLLEAWGLPAALGRLAGSEALQAVVDRLQEWEPTRAIVHALVDLDLPAAAREQLDNWQQQVDRRLFGDLSDRMRLASDEVETAVRAGMRELIARGIRNEMDLLPTAARVPAWGPCSNVETARVRLAYERMLEAAVPETVQRFTASVAPTGIFAAAAGIRSAAASRAIVKGLSGRLTRRLLPRIGRLIGVGAGAGAWLFLDLLVLYADEYFTREEFQAELTALVDEQKAGLKADLAARADQARLAALGPFTPAALEGTD